MPIMVLGNLAIKTCLMIALGYLLRKTEVISDELCSGLSKLLMNVILPACILSSASSTPSKELGHSLIQAAIIVAVYYIISLCTSWLISRKLSLSNEGKHIFVTLSVFANIGFIGFPLMKELFGDIGTLYAVIYNLVNQIFLFTIGIGLLSNNKNNLIKSLTTDPSTIASILALIIFLSPMYIPNVIQETFCAVGDMVVPISMMIIGCDLANMKFFEVIKDPYCYLTSFVRLIAYPLAMLVILRQLNVDSVLTMSMVVMTALPCGSLNAIMAKQYNCEPEYAARSVIQSMILMVGTIPAIIYILGLANG